MKDPVFIKSNPTPGTLALEAEVRGLEELRKHQPQHGLNIPRVFKHQSEELKLERIISKPPTEGDWSRLGSGLAQLHSVTARNFGFECDNFVGLNPQMNGAYENWGEFFMDQRLEFQIRRIKDKALQKDLLGGIHGVRPDVIRFLNTHHPKPSLVHGDLWSGNIMFSDQGPWLIDPAVYFGDREVDLAMTEMFGGFHPRFYSAYLKAFPVPRGYEPRKEIYNLYHFLNHYNLFGSSYREGVVRGIKAMRKAIST